MEVGTIMIGNLGRHVEVGKLTLASESALSLVIQIKKGHLILEEVNKYAFGIKYMQNI